MNRYDDRYWRGGRSEQERDPWRERDRQGREPSRESFHRGNYGFEDNEYSGRTAGGSDQQPFSGNPYGYHPGQNASGDNWRDRESRDRYGSERFGQREPYNTRGDDSRSWPFRGEGREDEHSRYGGDTSRYSESQYAAGGPHGFGSGYEPGRGGWRGQDEGRDEYRGEQYRGDQYRGDRYRGDQYRGDQYRGSQYRGGSFRGGDDYRRERYRQDESQNRPYDLGPDARYGSERGFGQGPFADMTEQPGYFGMGHYSDGGAAPTGGFDQRTRQRNYGSLAQNTFSSDRDWSSSNRAWRGSSERRDRKGPKGYIRSDERLREDICERLMMADSVDSSEVTVTVKDCQVTLEGSVPNRRMKHTIEDLVDAAPGVQDVDNRIRVEREGSRFGSSSTQSSSSGASGTSGAAGTSGTSGIGASGTGSATQRNYSQGTSTSGTSTTQGASTSGTSTTQRRKE